MSASQIQPILNSSNSNSSSSSIQAKNGTALSKAVTLSTGWSSQAPSSSDRRQHLIQRAQSPSHTYLKGSSATNRQEQIQAQKDGMIDSVVKKAQTRHHQISQLTSGEEDEQDEADELGGGGGGSGGGGPPSEYYHYSQRNDGRPRSVSHTALGVSNDWNSRESRPRSGTRKQLSSCDRCRNRKVKCNRLAGEDKCAHCKAKGVECTNVFVQMATAGFKRPVKRARQSTEGAVESSNTPAAQSEGSTSTVIRFLLYRDSDYPNAVQGLSYHPTQSEDHRIQPISAAESRLVNSTTRAEFVSDLIETYFSIVHTRYPILDPAEFRRRFHNPRTTEGGPPSDVLVAVILAWGAKFSENPIIVADRKEAADHLTPIQRMKRAAATLAKPASHVAIAAPVTRESLEKDKSMPPNHDDGAQMIGRSRIAEDLVVKAQEVLDRNKAHRVSKMDNIRAALIVEALFWRPSFDSVEGRDELGTQLQFRKRRGLYVCDGAWVSAAIWHLKELRIHQQETIERIADPAQRVQVSMCWWLACQMDAHMSAFYRRKPYLTQEDYTTDLPAPPPDPEQEGPHPLAVEQGYKIWLNSSQQQVEMMGLVYHVLWTPRVMTHGISAPMLEKLTSLAFAWRENHLSLVGAPSPAWPKHWNFADAVTACASDMNYHIVWIMMWEAIEEFGIEELKASNIAVYNQIIARNESGSIPKTRECMEFDQRNIRGLKSRIYDEALNGALRSANLSKVLCDNGYLRLEAGIMKWSMSEAGYCLTKFQRPEVTSIIEGLRQYGQAFEECYEQANELEQLANVYLHNDANTISAESSSLAAANSTSYHLGGGGEHLRQFSLDNYHLQSNQSRQLDQYSSPSAVYSASSRGGNNGNQLATTYAQSSSSYPQQEQPKYPMGSASSIAPNQGGTYSST